MLAEGLGQARLEGDDGYLYTEFSYMLLQAYDFLSCPTVWVRTANGGQRPVG